ncbi:hypothetical protein M422DRAFT_773360 [Sphaerobolus stellatus SS14]|nr:hypothetical protein M422DRAFT_773360 [Sphaerobolus stellatus SS14]
MAPSRPPSLLISSSSVARPLPSTSQLPTPSNSPFRFVQLQSVSSHPLDNSSAQSSPAPSRIPSPQPVHFPLRSPIHPRAPPPLTQQPHPFRIPDRLKPWLGIACWAATSLGFLLAIAFWKKEVFTGLDQLSSYLQSLGTLGYAILFCLIFITTIPPFPLYSTLIVLSGYTFGTWTGAVISYSAALSGAVIVFLVSRLYLRDAMSRLLSHTASLKRVVRAIEKRPRLLLLIRVAPYPYNLMNVLLAASHTLSFTTYFWCTALSLCKVVIHTSIGSGIHNFAGHHLGKEEVEEEDTVGKAWTVLGISLCIGILVYLSIVARRAVDEELEEDTCRLEEGRLSLEAEMREVVL